MRSVWEGEEGREESEKKCVCMHVCVGGKGRRGEEGGGRGRGEGVGVEGE